MTWPALLFWILIAGCTTLDGPTLIYLFGVSRAYDGLRMLPGKQLAMPTSCRR